MSQQNNPQQPNWTGGQGEPRPAKQKNWFARHKILTGIGVVAVIAVIGSSMSGGSGGSSSAASSTSTSGAAAPESQSGSSGSGSSGSSGVSSGGSSAASSKAEKKDLGVGTPVRDGQFEFTITKVQTGVKSVGDQYLGSTAQGQYVLISVTVKNIGDSSQTMFDSNQKVTDETGRSFDPDSTAELYMKNNDVWMKDVNPGNSVSGTLVYDMPKDAVPASIELHDSMFSGGVKVSLK